MDLNDLRSLLTVVLLAVFVATVAWAWSRGNRARFDEAARLPFEEEQATPTDVRRSTTPHR
jgi:cytochrome c oxidase cbb3-type subunit 4